MSNNEAPPIPVQQIIRLAQVVGPIIFVAIVMFIRSGEQDPEFIQTLMYAYGALLIMVIGITMFVVKPRRDAAESAYKVFVLNIVAGGLTETVALFGAVIALLGGPLYPALLGIVLIAITLFLYFPVPSE